MTYLHNNNLSFLKKKTKKLWFFLKGAEKNIHKYVMDIQKKE